MVEGAICAAIAIVFNLLFAYVPFMGIILNLIMPLPLVVCGMRNGLRWSIMAAVVSTVLVAMTVNPIHALFYIGVYGVMGIVLGECMHRHLPAQKCSYTHPSGRWPVSASTCCWPCMSWASIPWI